MKLSTKTRYGIRAMLELALCESSAPLSIKTIAENQGVPEPYLEQLMSGLKKAGLVTSTRGAQGGYALAKKPCDISFGDIFRALEGSMAPVECVDDSAYCAKSADCAVHMLYGRIMRGMEEVYNSISLEDMKNDQEKLRSVPHCAKE